MDQATKVVVITGSTRGIGLGLARSFLEAGCSVVVSGRSKAAVDGAVKMLSERYPAARILGQPCDVFDNAQVQALWDAAKAHFGKVDIWINNAGISNRQGDLWEQPPDMVQQVINTNLIGMIYGCQVAIRGMIAQGGGFVYNMEGLGSDGRIGPGLTLYGSTKIALRYVTRALAKETAKTPVKVGALSPGIVVTDMWMEQTNTKELSPGSQRILNLLGDRVETVSAFLVENVLANQKRGARIAWLTTRKVITRLTTGQFRKRNIVLPETP